MHEKVFPEIPLDEAEFYAKVSARNASLLSKVNSVEEVDPLLIDTMIFRCLVRLLRTPKPYEFLRPKNLWVSSVYTCLCEWDAYSHLSPVRGKKILEAGGTGLAAIQFMLAGAREAWLLTPVASEADYATEVARLAGVKVNCRVGVAEEMPFAPNTFDAVYTGGCLHHFKIPTALAEISRVLVAGGRFSAVEPWQAPFYCTGIKLFGKMEPVNCKPLNAKRMIGVGEGFSNFRVVHHGTLTRYPALALFKLGIPISLGVSWYMTKIDDIIASLLMIRKYGSCVAVLAEK